MNRYRLLGPYVLRQRGALIAIAILTLLTSLAVALQPWPLKFLADHALGQAPLPAGLPSQWSPAAMLWLAAGASLLLFFGNSLLDAALTRLWTRAGQSMVFALAGDVFERLTRSSLAVHARRSVGDALSRAVDDSWCVYGLVEGWLVSPLQRVVTILIVGVVAWELDRQLALLSFLAAPVLGATTWYFGRKIRQRARQHRRVRARLTSFVQQTLAAIPLIQAFGSEARNREQFGRLAEDAVELSQRGALLRNATGLVNGLMTTTGTALVLFVGGQRVWQHELTIGSLLVFLAYLQSLQGAARGLLASYAGAQTAEASLDRLIEVWEATDEVPEAPNPQPLPVPSPRRGARIAIERVVFGYLPDQPVLRDVSLEAQPGQTIAIVGATGAGKTTLVSLVPRFFDPWQGCVRLDGVDVRTVGLRELRSQIALVLQDPYLLPLSIADNIAYGRPDATREAVVAAATAAQADAFIRALPAGYDTVIGERGTTLSGGQRQRLAIARALLCEARVLILDEPTAALDAATEAELLRALERLMQNCTTLVIAHRLSTVRAADQIVVLEDGRVVESGRHAELLARGGAYRRFHDAQWGIPDRPEAS